LATAALLLVPSAERARTSGYGAVLELGAIAIVVGHYVLRSFERGCIVLAWDSLFWLIAAVARGGFTAVK